MKNSIFVLAFSLLLAGCHGGYDLGPDRVAPSINAPAPITVAAVDGSGTAATDAAITEFLNAASASDSVDGPVAVSNDAPPVFPLGTTTVTFSAVDSAGNEISVSALVTVVDITAPVLTTPEDIILQSSLADGAEVTRSEIEAFLNAASAEDNVDVTVNVSNDAPADFFPFGETLVEFVATDAAGNSASATAVVNVVPGILLTDFNATTQETDIDLLPAFVNDGVLDTDFTPKPLNLQNLDNALSEGDFRTPQINSVFGYLPTGSGTETATISVFDGLDSTRDPGERHLAIDMVFNWTSDGETLLIDFPVQILDGIYTSEIDTIINITLDNRSANSFTVTKQGIDYANNFDDSFFYTLRKLSGIPIDELLDAGIYTFQIVLSLPLTLIDGSIVTQVDAIVKIEADG